MQPPTQRSAKQPPNKLRPFQNAAPISPEKKASLAMAAPESSLPKNFSWRDKNSDNVTLTGVIDQKQCGNCWAVSTIQSLTDRVSVARARRAPGFQDIGNGGVLSVAWMTSCNDYCAGDNDKCSSACEGADIGTALKFLALDIFEGGVPYASCVPTMTQQEMEALNQKFSETLRKCQNNTTVAGKECLAAQRSCGACITNGSNVYVRRDSVSKLTDIVAAKQDIFLNGPVTAGFQVFADIFEKGKEFPPFQDTDGVYVYDGKAESSGYHAVSIVGWGEKTIKLNGVPTLVPFWEVRNSWGTEWGDQGFWKHAMRDTRKNINVAAGMEGTLDFPPMGGIISFQADVRKNPGTAPVAQKRENYGTSDAASTSEEKSGFNVYMAILLVLCLASVGVLVFLVRRRQKLSK